LKKLNNIEENFVSPQYNKLNSQLLMLEKN